MNDGMLVCVRDISINYGSGRQDAVEHVSMDIRRGEIMALVGSNGSGKSTLMKGILRLMPLTAGEIERASGLKVSYLSQIHLSERDFPATVGEIVLSGTLKRGFSPFYSRSQKKRAREAMEMLDILDLQKMHIGALSGGQMQRALLARCVASDPELMLLDEPCSALDPTITKDLYALFRRLRDEKKVSLVVATHNWDFVKESADRVLVLDRHVEYFGDISGWNGMEEKHTCHH